MEQKEHETLNSKLKLVLDILMGTVVPLLILNSLHERVGPATSYLVAALIPVAWVLLDLVLLTKRFNFITSYVGASAIVSGALAFWFVDGVRFAAKDSVGYIITAAVFAGSIVIGRPIMSAFFAQALQPRSARQRSQLADFFEEEQVARAVVSGTMLILGLNVVAGLVNFVLNLRIVVGEVGTVLFNQQIAQVNAITRVALGIPSTLGLLLVLAWIRHKMFQQLPEEQDGDEDIWDLLERRESTVMSPFKGCDRRFSGKVIVVGAGAAGLTAGHLLRQEGIDFEILEASSVYGGRMKKTDDFADFPIPLGAEWLTTDLGIFESIVNDPAVAVRVETVGYEESDPVALWRDGSVTEDVLGPSDDRKFVDGSWFDFFEDYIVSSVERHIVFDTEAQAIDYSGDTVIVTTPLGEFRADCVIVTVPLPVLQREGLRFTPELPRNKRSALKKARVWQGLKVFLEFREKFYPTYTDLHVKPRSSGHLTYFDAAYGQETTRNILGLFAVGTPAIPYLALKGEDLRDYILDELELIFPGKARAHYVQHISQNWTLDPHIGGAYLDDHQDWKTPAVLSEPLEDKVFFAGDAYTSGDDWGNVHDAALAARRAVKDIVRHRR